MIKKNSFLFLLGWFFSELSWSGASSIITPLITFSAGPAWYHAGHSETIWLQPDFQNKYVALTPLHQLTSGELFLGLQHLILNRGFGQLGIAFATTTPAHLQGNIWETADPLFDNFTYQYKITHMHVALKTKWLLNAWRASILPYISASIGVGWNKAYDFSMQPLIFEALPTSGFQAQRNTALTYTLGVGLEKILTAHWHLNIGYQFSDWGASYLKSLPMQMSNLSLGLNHLYNQQLQCAISYLF